MKLGGTGPNGSDIARTHRQLAVVDSVDTSLCVAPPARVCGQDTAR